MDSTFQVFFETGAGSSYSLEISYILNREGEVPVTLTSAPLILREELNSDGSKSATFYPHLSWIDSPPPGTHRFRIEIYAITAENVETLEVTNRALNAVAQITSDPFNIYVQAGAENGNGSLEHPFGTIEEGMNAVAEGGTVHILGGIYEIETQLVVAKPMTLLGHSSSPRPQIIFSPDTDVDGLVIEADNVTIDSLHLIANRNVTGQNAILRVPLRTTAPISLYNNITVRSCIIEGTTRSGYIWCENITIEDNEFLHHPVTSTQSLRLQLVRGTTSILNNTFQGSDSSLGAVVFEPNIVSWRSSGIINVSGNKMTRFTQFVNFFPHLDGNTSLVVENNDINHEDRSGNSVIFFSRVDFSLMDRILIQNNSIVNPHGTRLAVYFTRSGDGNFIPDNGQIQVHLNTFDFPNGYGNPATDTVDPEFPVGFNNNAEPLGMTMEAFDLQGNINV